MKNTKTIIKLFLIFTILEIFNFTIRDYYNLKHSQIFQNPTKITKEKIIIDDNLAKILENYPDMSKIINSSYIKVPKQKYMIPQGITKIGNTYTIITAYNHKGTDNSKCYILDKSGNIINTAILDTNSHVGGVAFDEKNGLLWIPDNGGILNAYELKKIINEKEVIAKYKFYDISKGLVNYQNSTNENVDYLSIDQDYLYVGNFTTKTNGLVKKYRIVTKRNSINLKLVHEFIVPSEIQGIAFYNHNNKKYMILSKSFGRRRNSKLIAYEYDESINDYSRSDTQRISLTLPPMLEQISTLNDSLYVLFESNARKYDDCTHKVETICELDLKKMFKEI